MTTRRRANDDDHAMITTWRTLFPAQQQVQRSVWQSEITQSDSHIRFAVYFWTRERRMRKMPIEEDWRRLKTIGHRDETICGQFYDYVTSDCGNGWIPVDHFHLRSTTIDLIAKRALVVGDLCELCSLYSSNLVRLERVRRVPSF